MSTLPRIISLASAVILLAITGCETTQVKSAFRVGLPQTVTIDSVPSDAKAFVNGEYVGVTPVTTELPRKVTHEVRFEKPGYRVTRKFFRPQTNDAGKALVRFGLMEEVGLHVDLTPTNMVAQMSHTLLPMSRSAEPFQDMTYRIMLADALLDSGAITMTEHSAIYSDIVSFYTE